MPFGCCYRLFNVLHACNLIKIPEGACMGVLVVADGLL